MRTSDALWELFKATGRIGAYLLYRQCFTGESEINGSLSDSCCTSCLAEQKPGKVLLVQNVLEMGQGEA